MATQRERVMVEFDLHIGEILNTGDMAKKTGISRKKVAQIINAGLTHRLEPPEGRNRTILPSDGFPDPSSAYQTREREDREAPGVKSVSVNLPNRHGHH